MPAQAVLVRRPVGHEVVAVVDEEADVAVGPIEHGDRQVGLAEGGPGDREGIDRIPLAGLPAGCAGHRP